MEIWSISWPMMLAAMSNYFMTFVDRIILSRYSPDAFVAAASAHTYYWAATRTMMAFVIMTSVFISQYHGAHNYRPIGCIVWQTLLISVCYYVFLIPMSIFSRELLSPTVRDLGAPYLSIILLFLPLHLMGFGAISLFFLGIGKTKIVPTVIMISNTINVVLDIVLINGYCGFPELGARGAAYATGISQLIAFVIFLYNFLKRRYRLYYRTHVPNISWPVIKKILTYGVPNSINSALNSGGFAIVAQFIATACSADDLLAFNIANSIYMFFWFFSDGLGKGICTISANYIGNNQVRDIRNVSRSTIKVIVMFAIITSLFMVSSPNLMLRLFYGEEVSAVFFDRFRVVLFWTWVALITDALRWMMQNILIAAKDIQFTVLSNVSCFWIAAFSPIYVFVYLLRAGGAVFCWQCFILDSFCRIISNRFRLYSKTWQRKAHRAARASRRIKDQH